MKALKATGVCRAYGKGALKVDVLRDFDLTIDAGAFVALMGPSGSGKSTFLHLAAGLLAADAGTICVDGEDVTKMSDAAATRFRRRHAGVVFQDFNLVDTLTVAENIVLPVALDGARADGVRLTALLGKLGLAGKEHRKPGELSGGERQRVAIARALFAEPAVVLADEPTGNLDAAASRGICDLLKDLNKTEKSAILLVTHDPVVAACASEVCFLKDGRIAARHATAGDPARVSELYLETCK